MTRLVLLTATLLFVIGCSKQEIPAEIYEDNLSADTEETEVTVRAGLPVKNSTKVGYELDNDAGLIKTSWEEGDIIWYYGSTRSLVQTGAISEDGKFANFNGNLSVSANKQMLFSYPVKYASSSGGTFKLSSQGGSLKGLKNYDFMTAMVKTGADKTIPELSFKRRISVLELAGITFPSDLTATVSRIFFEGTNIANRMTMNVNTGEPAGYYRDATITVTPDSTITIENGVMSDTLVIAFFADPNSAAGDQCKVVFQMSDGKMYQKEWTTSGAYKAGNAYLLSGEATLPMSSNIEFADPDVKAICVRFWDLNGDGELSDVEASLVTGLQWAFNSIKTVDSFNEFQYFTGITTFDGNNSGQSGGFMNCTNLKEITLPESVTLIGSDAFNGCSSLKSIVVPGSVKKINAGAFRNCTSLTSISIPETVSYMGEGAAFAGCTSLTTVDWPDSTTTIPSQTFQNSGITDFTIPATVTSVGISAFSGCQNLKSVNIPSSVESIGYRAFMECTGLSSIVISSGVKTIGNQAFYASGLKSVSIAASVESIGSQAFNSCAGITSFSIADGSAYSVSDDISVLVRNGTEAVGFFGNKESVTFPASVTTIGDSFARGAANLKSVYIPSVSTLGDFAFAECPVLHTAVFASDATTTGTSTFQNDAMLVNVTLPAGVTEIGKNLFSGCTSLKTLALPSSVVKINSGAFTDCSSLESIALPSSLTEIVSSLFKGCSALKSVSIPEGVSKIGTSAFEGCSSLTTISLPSALKSIPASLLKDCTGLTSIDIPSGVTSIGNSAFSGCTGLTSLALPAGVTAIPMHMISGCSNITSFEIPASVTKLNSYAFKGTGLKTIVVPSGIKEIPSSLFEDCTSLESVSLPSDLTTVGMSAFKNCISLKTLVIPDNVTKLPMGAFENCTGLVSVSLPAKLASLDTYVFQGCSSLQVLTVPASVTKINNWAFTECTALKEIVMESTTPCTVYANSFKTSALGASETTTVEAVYVPDASYDAYVAAPGWSNYWKSVIYRLSDKE